VALGYLATGKDYKVKSGNVEQLLILPTGVTHGQEDCFEQK